MRKDPPIILLSAFLFLFLSACGPGKEVAAIEEIAAIEEVKILPPEDLYGQLFYDVQQNKQLFPDSKTFVDVVPRRDVDEIRKKYTSLKDPSTQEIRTFIQQNFITPGEANKYITDSSSINDHISKLWKVLKRPEDEKIPGTLIPLPNPYIVPGGRFREIYYWDSYFTMLGLQEDGEVETIRNMVDNFSYLIENFGFIPNGNRTYYLSRSQPPFFAKMVEVLSEEKGKEILQEYLPSLVKEYQFWMKGEEDLIASKPENRRVIRMPGGEILNRYWDNKDNPRPESYREDVATADEALQRFPGTSREKVYRNLRAAAESGWDFSSRWLKQDENGDFHLSTIHTTDILPVDLNSLLYNLERTISEAYQISGEEKNASEFGLRAENRRRAMKKYFWNEEKGFFMDYDFIKGISTNVISLAGVYPLFFEIADKTQANQVSEKIKEIFLKPGGVVTTPHNTGQQWDAPNGWAPLQYLTIEGLKNYGHVSLAAEIKDRWLKINEEVYNRTYKMLEKYNVQDLSKESGGGEYPTQDGFGWTNGVYQKLSREN